jgi:hypothetical protein
MISTEALSGFLIANAVSRQGGRAAVVLRNGRVRPMARRRGPSAISAPPSPNSSVADGFPRLPKLDFPTRKIDADHVHHAHHQDTNVLATILVCPTVHDSIETEVNGAGEYP